MAQVELQGVNKAFGKTEVFAMSGWKLKKSRICGFCWPLRLRQVDFAAVDCRA